MNEIWLIARKDLRSYFASPIAYIIIAFFIFLIGWMFFNFLSMYMQGMQQYAAVSFGQKPTLTDYVLKPLFGNVNVILLFVVPFITMRLLAEEQRDHTIELLVTSPISPLQIVLGKFLAGLVLVSVLVVMTGIFPAVLAVIAKPDWGVILGSYVGLFLVSCTYVGIGLFWSSRTDNQIVAAICSFGTLLFFWLVSWPAHSAGPIWGDVLTYLSIISHYTNFAQGVLDTTDLIFYVSFTAFSLFLTNLSFDTFEWS